MIQVNSGISHTPHDNELRETIARAMKRSPLKREVIAEELTKRLGIRVTLSMLNDYTSHNKKGVRFPLLFSSVLCDILDDDSIGLLAVRPRIRQLIEFAEKNLATIRDQKELDSLREQLLDELVERATSEQRVMR